MWLCSVRKLCMYLSVILLQQIAATETSTSHRHREATGRYLLLLYTYGWLLWKSWSRNRTCWIIRVFASWGAAYLDWSGHLQYRCLLILKLVARWFLPGQESTRRALYYNNNNEWGLQLKQKERWGGCGEVLKSWIDLAMQRYNGISFY